jgi:ABC-type antimicrobial peptide transport system ATPase subunit
MSNAYAGNAAGTIEPRTATNSMYVITTSQTMRFMSFINTNNKDVIVSINTTKSSSADDDYNRMYIFKIQ